MPSYHAIKPIIGPDSLDACEAKHVEITIRGSSIWINTEDGCIVRLIRCGEIVVKDERTAADVQPPTTPED